MRAGADRVMSPYQIGGLQLAQTALRPAVVDFVQLATSSDNLELNMEQVRIGDGVVARRAHDPRVQRCGSDSASSSSASSAPAARMEFNPPPESVMRVGDFLVVLGRAKNLRELEAAAASPASSVCRERR